MMDQKYVGDGGAWIVPHKGRGSIDGVLGGS